LYIKSWNDVIKSGALVGIAALDIEESVDILIENAKRGNSEQSRMISIGMMPKISSGKEKILDFLINSLEDPYRLIQLSSATALGWKSCAT